MNKLELITKIKTMKNGETLYLTENLKIFRTQYNIRNERLITRFLDTKNYTYFDYEDKYIECMFNMLKEQYNIEF